MLKISEHIEQIIELSDVFEKELYDWARESSSPRAAVDKIKRVMAEEFPDRYSATRDDLIKVNLIRKEFEDVRWRIEKEALARPWGTSSEDTSKN